MKNIFKKLICAALIFNPLSMKSAAMESWASGIKEIVTTEKALQSLAIINAAGCLGYAGYKTYRALTKKMLTQDMLDEKQVRAHLNEKINSKKQKLESPNTNPDYFKGWLGGVLSLATGAKIGGALRKYNSTPITKANVFDAAVISLVLPQVTTYCITKVITKSIEYVRRKKNKAVDNTQLAKLVFKQIQPFEDLSTIDENNNQCGICLGELRTDNNQLTIDEKNQKQQLTQTTCQHFYHTNCVAPWLKKNESCPTCRATLQSYSPASDLNKLASYARRSASIDQNAAFFNGYMTSAFLALGLTIIEARRNN